MNDTKQESELRETYDNLAALAFTLDPAGVVTGAKRRRSRMRARGAVLGAALATIIAGAAPHIGSVTGLSGGPEASTSAAEVPGDVIVDGIRYPEKPAGERLIDVEVGAKGQAVIEFTTRINDRTVFRPMCTSSTKHFLKIEVNGLNIENRRAKASQACRPDHVVRPDERQLFSVLDSVLLRPPSHLYGKSVRIRAQLIDIESKAVTTSADTRIALGVYERQSTRTVGRYELPTVREFDGRRYRLLEVNAVKRSEGGIRVETPAGQPFLLSFGGDSPGEVRLAGVTARPIEWTDGDLTTLVSPARRAGIVTASNAAPSIPGKTDPNRLMIVALYGLAR